MFTFAVVAGLILPVLVMEGIFMDGLLYATVSKNLANGYGSMWMLKYSHYGFAEHATFHEHPPLIFWMQSVYFKLFGNGMWVERFYSFSTAIAGAWLIVKNWKLIFPQHFKSTGWLPVLLWIIIPVGFWSYQNNMHENTLAIFALASTYFMLKAVHLEQQKWTNLLLAACMIFCAGFAKGIPGLFTIAALFFHWLIFRKQSFIQMVLNSLILVIVPLLILFTILQIPAAKESLSIYFYDRLLGRIDAAHTADSHFFILIRLVQEILPSLVLVGITLLVLKWRKVQLNIQSQHLKWALFFFLIGLSGSIPLMLTLVQKTFYFVGSLPFFGLSFACLLAPSIQPLIEKINKLKIIPINSGNTNYFDLKSIEKKLNSVDFVVHLSSATGGIKYAKDNMSEQFYIATMKDLNIFQASKNKKVKKVITLGNLHAYPKNINGILREEKQK